MDRITPFDKQEIIDENRKEIEGRLAKNPSAAEAFCVSEERLDEVLEMVDNAGTDLEFLDKVITKAAYFLGGLTWAQPFCGGNKSTALLMTMVFLQDNGFKVEIPEIDEAFLIDLLYEVQTDRTSPSHEIIQKLILYMQKKISHV